MQAIQHDNDKLTITLSCTIPSKRHHLSILVKYTQPEHQAGWCHHRCTIEAMQLIEVRQKEDTSRAN